MAGQNVRETPPVDQPNRLQVCCEKRKRSNCLRSIGAGRERRLNHPEFKANTYQPEFTKMSTNIEEFSYVSKFVALTHLYVELSLPLPAALRAAEADLR